MHMRSGQAGKRSGCPLKALHFANLSTMHELMSFAYVRVSHDRITELYSTPAGVNYGWIMDTKLPPGG